MKRYFMATMAAASVLLGGGQAALAACTNPAGVAGAMIYNTDFNVMQFCNNTSWLSMGSGAAGITALTGDVAASGTGSVGATIQNDAVTFAKMQNISTGVLLGRSTASTGDTEQITVGSGLSLTAGTLTATGGLPAADTLDFTEFKDIMALDANTAMLMAHDKTLTISSVLTAGSRSTFGVVIQQPNDATNDSVASLLQVVNADTGSVSPPMRVETYATSGYAMMVSGYGGSGGIWVPVNNSPNSFGLKFDYSGNLTGGQALAVTGGVAGDLGNFYGDMVRIDPTRENTSGTGSTTDSGNYLDVTRNTIMNASGKNHTITGEMVRLVNTGTQTAGTLADTSMVVNVSQSYAAATGDTMRVTNLAAGNSFVVYDSSGDSSPFVVDASGNVGVGNGYPSVALDVQSGATSLGIRHVGTNTLGASSGGGLLLATNGVPSAAAQRLGLMTFGGMLDGTTWGYGAGVSAFSAEAWNTVKWGAYMQFETTAIGSGTRTERLRIDPSGGIGIGTLASNNASALLQVDSTTRGFLPPRMTTVQVNAIATPLDGLMVYDTDTKTVKLRANGAWGSLGGGTPAADSLDFTELADTMNLDATTTIKSPAGQAYMPIFQNEGTGDTFRINYNSSGSSAFFIDANGNIGVGTTSPQSRMSIARTAVSTTTTEIATTLGYISGAPPSASTSTFIGIQGQAVSSSNFLGGQMQAVRGLASYTGSNASSSFTGGSFSGEFSNVGGSMDLLRGARNAADNTAAGTVARAYGNWSELTNVTGGTITEAAAYRADLVNAGTVTNYYGLRVENDAASATNTWGVYVDGTMRSYFGGRVGIGTGVSAPNVALDVNGAIVSRVNNASASTSIDFSLSNVAYTSAACGAFTLSGMQDGGSYSLIVKGNGTGPATFTHSSLTPKTTGTLTCQASKHTVFTFLRAGTDFYVSMVSGY